jgi:hypothetical protein
MEGGVVPTRDGPVQVVVVAGDALSGSKGIYINEAEPQSEDASIDDASAPGSLRGPCRDNVVSSPGLTLPSDVDKVTQH